MNQSRQIVTLILFLLMPVLVSAVSLYVWLGYSENQYFEVSKGDSYASIIERFGQPDKTENRCLNIHWGEYPGDKNQKKNTGECVRVVIYNEFFLRRYYFGFTRDNKVISKFYGFSE